MSNFAHLVKECKSGNILSLTGNVITLFSRKGTAIRRSFYPSEKEARKIFFLIVGV